MNSSTLNRLAGLIPDMALKDRIQELLDAGHSKSGLARAAKKNPASVTHWLNGATLEIKSDSAAGLQALTGFNAVWIATGKGPKKSGPEYPTPPATAPSLADTLAQLGEVIAASDKLTRAQIRPILDQLLETPEQAAELGQRLQATIAIQQGRAASPVPAAETKDFAPPVPSSKFLKTRESS